MKTLRFSRRRVVIIGFAVLPLWAFAAVANLTGAGSTFVSPIMQRWISDYQKESGQVVEYSVVGSSAGVKQITDKAVTFGATDMPLDSVTLKTNGQVTNPSPSLHTVLG